MKILFLDSVQNFGGASRSNLELAKRMIDIGHEVHIVDFWGSTKPYIDKIKEYGLPYQIIDERDKPYVISSPSLIKKATNIRHYFTLQATYRQKFQKISAQISPDIVIVNNLRSLNILNNQADYSIDYFVRGWRVTSNLPVSPSFLLKRYNLRYITVSQATRQALFISGVAELDETKVLHSVIDSKKFVKYDSVFRANKTESDCIKLLHSGGFLPSKGQHITIEVAKILKEKSVNFSLVLAGFIYDKKSEDYYKSIVSTIKKYKLENYITIILNQSDIQEYFKNTDVLLHPSSTEGLPRVALEALSYGKPVIANSVGGVTDVVIHNFTGFITDFNNAHDYVAYIMKYYNSDNLYNTHSYYARSLIKENYLDCHQAELIRNIYPI